MLRPCRQMCHLIAMSPFHADAAFSFSPGTSSQPRLHWAGASPASSVVRGWGWERGRENTPPAPNRLFILDPAAWLQRGVGSEHSVQANICRLMAPTGARSQRESCAPAGRGVMQRLVFFPSLDASQHPLLSSPYPTAHPQQAPHTPQALMLSPASLYQDTPPSLPCHEPP